MTVTRRAVRRYPLIVAWVVGVSIVTVVNSAFIYQYGGRIATTAKTAAIQKANYDQCMASRDPLKRFNRHVRGVNELATALVVNSKRSHRATPKGSALYRAQAKNIVALSRATQKIAALAGFPVPTRKQCLRRLHPR